MIAEGAEVVGLIRSDYQDSLLYFEDLDRKIKLIVGDITNGPLIKSILSEERIQNIFLLAAQVEVGVARHYPYATWEANIRGTYTVLEAIREIGLSTIESIVLASSDKAYGPYPKEEMPYQENYPLKPTFPYDVSKACSDMIAQSYTSDLYKLPLIVTRFTNIYGPGQLNFSALIPDCIRTALGLGDFIPRSNGKHMRDYLYVEDVCDLYLIISKALSEKPELRGEIFNCGTNTPKSVEDVIREIYSNIGSMEGLKHIENQFKGNEALGEIDAQFMTHEKVENFFNWKPKTEFSTGLKKTITWYQSYLDKRSSE